jgi:hypothetical protein
MKGVNEAPKIKFCENKSWDAKSRAKKSGANMVEGLGIKKISLVNNLTKSSPI